MLHDTRKKLWPFSDIVAAISAALHKTFVGSKYANSGSKFLYCMRIICCIYKDFVQQLKAFLPSFCHLCACEMSPVWGHLITWMDPSVGHLNGILARVGGNLNNNFQKSQMPGGKMLKLWFDRYIKFSSNSSVLYVGKLDGDRINQYFLYFAKKCWFNIKSLPMQSTTDCCC